MTKMAFDMEYDDPTETPRPIQRSSEEYPPPASKHRVQQVPYTLCCCSEQEVDLYSPPAVLDHILEKRKNSTMKMPLMIVSRMEMYHEVDYGRVSCSQKVSTKGVLTWMLHRVLKSSTSLNAAWTALFSLAQDHPQRSLLTL